MKSDVVLRHVFGTVVDGREGSVAVEERFDVHVASDEADDERVEAVDLLRASTNDDVAGFVDPRDGFELLVVEAIPAEVGPIPSLLLARLVMTVSLGTDSDLERNERKKGDASETR